MTKIARFEEKIFKLFTIYPFMYIIIFFIHLFLFYLDKSIPLLTITLNYVFISWLLFIFFLFSTRRKIRISYLFFFPALMVVCLLLIFVVSFFINLIYNYIEVPLEIRIRSFLEPLSIFLYFLLILLFPLRKESVFAILDFLNKLLFSILIIDIIVSFYEIFLFYVKELSTYFLFINERINSVLFFDKVRVFGIFNSGLNHGFFLLLSIVVLYYKIRTIQSYKKFFYLLLFFLSNFLIFFTFTRNVLLTYFILIILIANDYFKNRFNLRIRMFINFVVIFFTFIFICILVLKIPQLFDPTNLVIRLKEWQYFTQLVFDDIIPMLVGTGLIQGYWASYLKFCCIDNLWVSLLFSFGICGLIIFTLLIIYFFYFFYKKQKRCENPYISISIYFLIILISTGFFNNIFYMWQYTSFIYLYIALTYKLLSKNSFEVRLNVNH